VPPPWRTSFLTRQATPSAKRTPAIMVSSAMLGWPGCSRLLGQQGDVHEAAAHGAAGELVLHAVEHMVADEGAGALRDARRIARHAQRRHHGLDGQGREVGRRRIRDHRLVDRLAALVVGDAGVIHIDGHALHREFAAPGGLAQRQHQLGLMLGQRLGQALQRRAEHAGQLPGQHAGAGHLLAVQRPGHLPGGVDVLAAKGLEARQQDGAALHIVWSSADP